VAEVLEVEDEADLLRLGAVSARTHPQRLLRLCQRRALPPLRRPQRLRPLAAPVARRSAARLMPLEAARRREDGALAVRDLGFPKENSARANTGR
jgi:hypothetical protein